MSRVVTQTKVKLQVKLDELFQNWLGLDETQDFINSLLESAKRGTLDQMIAEQHHLFSIEKQPPLSPSINRNLRTFREPERHPGSRSSPISPDLVQTTPPSKFEDRTAAQTSLQTHHKDRLLSKAQRSKDEIPKAPRSSYQSSAHSRLPSTHHPSFSAIPSSMFYPQLLPVSPSEEQINGIHEVCMKHKDRITLDIFRKEIIKPYFELPRWFARPIFRRILRNERLMKQYRLVTRRSVIVGNGNLWQCGYGGDDEEEDSSGEERAERKTEMLFDEDDEIDAELSRVPGLDGKRAGNDDKSMFPSVDLENATIAETQIVSFYKHFLMNLDKHERLFNAVRKQKNQFVQPNDWVSFIEDLLATHPGLDFLKNTPEFQQRYAETVIVRIFYTVNRKEDERMTLAELAKSDLTEQCHFCDEETNINLVHRYFSYEHFYVLYCKFWELDTDHDQIINDQNLAKYNNFSLSSRTVDRIINQQAPRRLGSGIPGRMDFKDFIWFLLSEEDKTTDTAISYWFRVVDLDDDGILSAWEMEQFFGEQQDKLDGMDMDLVKFEDILVQCVDMIKPHSFNEAGNVEITLADMKRSSLASNVFNILTNLSKYITFETKDPFGVKDQSSQMSDWERFAQAEYDRLSLEDETDDGVGTDYMDLN
ncbi:putative Serine/threonine protein phosphatase 2A regulatory subunit B''beta [Blattamonas nauphoetae]|uniref:Serine/threonine protein phosphatase 2A regulatory subunit B''beta n=1 Tax=Blattamonas nauphoetae TaxID=2049346 RepID=A0ABQ9Y9V4_9EUKA|nr:putative Serine/threonine protein phosphatase 2A regulatory subunit B''beta [Blattamonas nauphoetae]